MVSKGGGIMDTALKMKLYDVVKAIQTRYPDFDKLHPKKQFARLRCAIKPQYLVLVYDYMRSDEPNRVYISKNIDIDVWRMEAWF